MERCLNGSYTKGGNTTSDVVLETMLMIYRFDKIKITAFPLPSLDGCLVVHGRNMKTQNSRSYIPYTIGILIAVFVIYKIQQFVSRPDAFEKTLEFLSGIALCFGAVVLFMAVALIAPSLASRIKEKPYLKTTDLHYEVDAVRTRPAVDSLKAYGLLGGGVFYNVWMLGFGYMVVARLIDEVQGIHIIRAIDLSNLFGLLFFALFALVHAAISILVIMNGMAIYVHNQSWMRGATEARAAIIDRREQQTITEFDYEYGGYTVTYELILQVEGQPGVPELSGRFIQADVSERIFRKYARKDRVVIYYATQSPLTLILHGE